MLPTPSTMAGGNNNNNTPKDDTDNSTSNSSWLEQTKQRWKGMMDDQRLERLERCRALDQVLADCQRQDPNRQQLEDFPYGIRMVRYFDWRNYSKDTSCQREVHSVWACRGTALACGPDVVRLRNCLQEAGPDAVLQDPKNNAYEKANPNAICGDLQRALVECADRNSRDLEERYRSR